MPQVLPEGTVNVYFEAAAVIVSLILLGRYFEAKAKGRTSQTIQHLVGMQPKTAVFNVMVKWLKLLLLKWSVELL